MALITDATTQWSDPVTLVQDEIWQARRSDAFVTTTENPDAQDGLRLFENQALRFSAGTKLRYRVSKDNGAPIVREAV